MEIDTHGRGHLATAELAEVGLDPETYLAHVAAEIRAHGWTPAAASERPPTWRQALERTLREIELTAPDRRRAHEVLGWTASLHPRDPQGYRARLAACLAKERLAVADLPLAASAVRAFNVHLYHEIRGRRQVAERDER